MRTTIPTPGPISGGRRLRLAAIALGLLLVFGFAQTAGAQSATAADPPLTFAQNYLVRGDYVVAGAYNMTSTFTVINGNQYAVGTINIPDIQNKGIQGQNMVPAGAEVVAAVLYWQTVEKIGVTPGGPGSGQSGFFRPIIKNSVGAIIGPPSPGYVIGGVALASGGTNTVSWSSGGCTGGSTGKVIRTYRANVLAALPLDKNGNIIVNGSDPATGNTYGRSFAQLRHLYL